MSFFAQSSGFCINDSHISEIGRDYNININFATGEPAERVVTRLLGKRKRRDSEWSEPDAPGLKKRYPVCDESSHGLMIVQPMDIELHRELTSGSNYRMHLASYRGRVVAVKVLDGPCAKQNWTMNVTLAKRFLHPNVPKVFGVSSESVLESPFIVFHGVSERRMNSLLAKALRTDLNKSVELSMKTVKGLAAGLSYMESHNILSEGMLNTLEWENFDILASCSNEPLISINLPSDTATHGPHLASSFHNMGNHGSGIEVLNGLCHKLFSEVNSILYDDSPEREFDTYDSENFSRVVQIPSENLSNTPESSSDSTERCTVNKTTRREVWWKPDKSKRNRSLDSIARRFEDYLDCVSSPFADSPLRRIKASHSKWISHRCPGYLREEITLAADVSRSAVVAHQYPSHSEICSMCGQLVQHPTEPAPRQTKYQSPPPQEAPPPPANQDIPRAKASDISSPYQPGPMNHTPSLALIAAECYQAVMACEDEAGRKRCELFRDLPDRRVYPDYYSIIAQPIALSHLRKRANSKYYKTVQQYRNDWSLIFNNARTYNQEGSWVYNDANEMEKVLDRTLSRLIAETDKPNAPPTSTASTGS